MRGTGDERERERSRGKKEKGGTERETDRGGERKKGEVGEINKIVFPAEQGKADIKVKTDTRKNR